MQDTNMKEIPDPCVAKLTLDPEQATTTDGQAFLKPLPSTPYIEDHSLPPTPNINLQAHLLEPKLNSVEIPSHAILTAAGFPRPIANPLVPSGIRGPGGCLAIAGCSPITGLFEGEVPR
jgi:hypothetical protein